MPKTKAVSLVGSGAASLLLVGCALLTDLSGLAADAGVDGATDAGAGDARGPDAEGADGASDSAPSSAYRAAVLSDSPIGYWRLGEASGSVAKDETGNNDGFYASAGFTYAVPGALANDGDTAIHCGGAGAAASVSSSAFDFDGNAPFTIELWARPTGMDTNYRYLLGHEVGAPRDGWGVFSTANGGDNISFERLAPDAGIDDVGLPVGIGSWLYVVFTFDGTNVMSYLNAVESQQYAFVDMIAPASAPLDIGGGLFASTGFEGDLDEVAVYGQALAPARIAAHYKAGMGL